MGTMQTVGLDGDGGSGDSGSGEDGDGARFGRRTERSERINVGEGQVKRECP